MAHKYFRFKLFNNTMKPNSIQKIEANTMLKVGNV